MTRIDPRSARPMLMLFLFGRDRSSAPNVQRAVQQELTRIHHRDTPNMIAREVMPKPSRRCGRAAPPGCSPRLSVKRRGPRRHHPAPEAGLRRHIRGKPREKLGERDRRSSIPEAPSSAAEINERPISFALRDR